MENNERKSNFWDVLGQVVALVLTLVYILYVSNAYFNYFDMEGILGKIISVCMLYGPMILIIISCMDALKKRTIVLRILFLAIWVVIFIFTFFPGVLPF